MGHQVIKQPNGKFAVWSTIIDNFILVDATPEDIIKDNIENYKRGIIKDINDIVKKLNNGKKPYAQFTITWGEAKEIIKS